MWLLSRRCPRRRPRKTGGPAEPAGSAGSAGPEGSVVDDPGEEVEG